VLQGSRSIRGLFLILVIALSCLKRNPLHAQNIGFAKSIIDTLCAPTFLGRGYVDKGDSLTAAFLQHAFKEAGLHPLGDDHFQDFQFDVNTLPGDIEVQIDGKPLRPGSDFLIAPFSAGGKSVDKVEWLRIGDILTQSWVDKMQSSAKKVLALDLAGIDTLSASAQQTVKEFIAYLKYEGDLQPKSILLHHHKEIPWSVSTHQGSKPVIELISGDIPADFNKVKYDIDARFIEDYRSKNVIGLVPGTEVPDTAIFITAHYDHLGAMGRATYFPGANDNASGVAMMLDLAHHIQKNPARYTVVFVAFGAEEAGLIGSKYFTENPPYPLKKIKFLINIDLVGTGEEGITAVNGQQYKQQFDQLRAINEDQGFGLSIMPRGQACNSDHCFFHQRGVPSFFIYARGGSQAYHSIHDKPGTLSLAGYEEIFQLLEAFIGQQ